MEDLKTIRISVAVYDEVRAYCDGAGLRFSDFVEDAIASAPTREEELDLIREADESLESIDQARKRSYRRGFWDGFCASFFASQGRMGLCVAKTPEVLQAKKDPFKVSTGRQMQLFED